MTDTSNGVEPVVAPAAPVVAPDAPVVALDAPVVAPEALPHRRHRREDPEDLHHRHRHRHRRREDLEEGEREEGGERHRHRRRQHSGGEREEGAPKDGGDQPKQKKHAGNRKDLELTPSALKRLASGTLSADQPVTICALNGSQLLQTAPSH